MVALDDGSGITLRGLASFHTKLQPNFCSSMCFLIPHFYCPIAAAAAAAAAAAQRPAAAHIHARLAWPVMLVPDTSFQK